MVARLVALLSENIAKPARVRLASFGVNASVTALRKTNAAMLRRG